MNDTTPQTFTMPYNDSRTRRWAAIMLADLVREGVTFKAHVIDDDHELTMKVQFTGGY